MKNKEVLFVSKEEMEKLSGELMLYPEYFIDIKELIKYPNFSMLGHFIRVGNKHAFVGGYGQSFNEGVYQGSITMFESKLVGETLIIECSKMNNEYCMKGEYKINIHNGKYELLNKSQSFAGSSWIDDIYESWL